MILGPLQTGNRGKGEAEKEGRGRSKEFGDRGSKGPDVPERSGKLTFVQIIMTRIVWAFFLCVCVFVRFSCCDACTLVI